MPSSNKTTNQLYIFLFILIVPKLGLNAQEVTKSLKFTGDRPTSSITSENLKKNSNGDYFIITKSTGESFEVGSEVFEFEEFPIEQQHEIEIIGSGDVYYLIKLDDCLDVKNVVRIRGDLSYDLAISNDRVFVSVWKREDTYYYIDDMVLPPVDGEQSLVLEFDHDLNLIDIPVRLKQWTRNIAAYGDSTLYVNAVLKNRDSIIFDQDTLYNFLHDTWGYGETEAIIKYNYITQALDTMWRLGSTDDDVINNMECDEEGNLIIAGESEHYKITFDDINEINNSYGHIEYIVKYDSRGKLQWYHISPPESSAILVRMWLQSNGDIFVNYGLGNNSKFIVGSDTITPMLSDTAITNNFSVLTKFNKEGMFQWTYQPDAIDLSGGIYDIAKVNDTVIISYGVFRCDELRIGSELIGSIRTDDGLFKLDANTGEAISVEFFYRENTSSADRVTCTYIEQNPNSHQVRMLFDIYEHPYELFSQSWGTEGKREKYFLEIDGGACISSVHHSLESSGRFDIYPNPILQSSPLSLDIENIDVSRVDLLNSQGRVLQSWSSSEVLKNNAVLTLSYYASGIYYIGLLTKFGYQTKLLSITD